MSRPNRRALIGVGPGALAAAMALVWLSGCVPSDGPPRLVVATTWPPELRQELEESFAERNDRSTDIEWVVLETDAAIDRAIDRRGGVDVLLGGSLEAHDRLARAGRLVAIDPSSAVPWQVARHQETNARFAHSDPRDDPAALAEAKAVIDREGWPKGYESLVRDVARSRVLARRSGFSEGISLPIGGKNLTQARRFIDRLKARNSISEAGARSIVEARVNGLLADILGSALVDALEELREAEAALTRFGHPPKAEAALGERPPWPPASVAKLQSGPNGGLMLETLLEQVAPDPESRAWLANSWSRPKQSVDGALLAEIAGAADGRLALEPRFRAWLRGEWTAWNRQLYRRVARVAGGYVPS